MQSSQCQLLSMGETPDRVDPRKHMLWDKGFLKTENQGQIGSCQGQSLTECGEFCYTLKTGLVIQFSRMFAYIESQKHNNIRTDSGSTLTGGTHAAKNVGSVAKRSHRIRHAIQAGHTSRLRCLRTPRAAKLQSHTDIKQEEAVRQYIGSASASCRSALLGTTRWSRIQAAVSLDGRPRWRSRCDFSATCPIAMSASDRPRATGTSSRTLGALAGALAVSLMSIRQH